MELKDRVFRYRALHNLSQTQMAELLGVKMHTVYRLESLNRISKTHRYKIEVKMNELEN